MRALAHTYSKQSLLGFIVHLFTFYVYILRILVDAVCFFIHCFSFRKVRTDVEYFVLILGTCYHQLPRGMYPLYSIYTQKAQQTDWSFKFMKIGLIFIMFFFTSLVGPSLFFLLSTICLCHDSFFSVFGRYPNKFQRHMVIFGWEQKLLPKREKESLKRI